MKDVISVDSTIEQILGHLAGRASMCWDVTPRGVFEPEKATEAVVEAQAKLHSLLISKLPEKLHEGVGIEHSHLNRRIGWNSAIDEMEAVLGEMFEVKG